MRRWCVYAEGVYEEVVYVDMQKTARVVYTDIVLAGVV